MEHLSDHPPVDLRAARAAAEDAATHWGLTMEPPFGMASVSHVAPAGRCVVKVPWEGDDESLHEPDALELWDGDAAVRLLDRSGRALLLQRAIPGTDLSALPEARATRIAVSVATRLWRPAQEPFRPVTPFVQAWLTRAEKSQRGDQTALVPLARELLRELAPSHAWVVHGDLHHHNILRDGGHYVAIDPKPYAADREYDVPPFLWNPIGNRLADPDLVEQRIGAFVAAGLDDFRIRAWTVIRGAYLRPWLAGTIRALLG